MTWYVSDVERRLQSPPICHRHVKRCGGYHRVECPYCLEQFSRKDVRDRHVRRKHPQCPKPDCLQCKKCGETFNYKEVLQQHLNLCKVQKQKFSMYVAWLHHHLHEEAGYARTYSHRSPATAATAATAAWSGGEKSSRNGDDKSYL